MKKLLYSECIFLMKSLISDLVLLAHALIVRPQLFVRKNPEKPKKCGRDNWNISTFQFEPQQKVMAILSAHGQIPVHFRTHLLCEKFYNWNVQSERPVSGLSRTFGSNGTIVFWTNVHTQRDTLPFCSQLPFRFKTDRDPPLEKKHIKNLSKKINWALDLNNSTLFMKFHLSWNSEKLKGIT